MARRLTGTAIFFITTTRFAARMESLRQHHCSVLSLGEAIDRLYRCDLPGRAVVITFDDGFANFHSNALPILKRYGFPATVYVSTYYSEHANLPVFPVACSYLLWKARGQIRRGLNIPGVPGNSTCALLRAGNRLRSRSSTMLRRRTTRVKQRMSCYPVLRRRLGRISMNSASAAP